MNEENSTEGEKNWIVPKRIVYSVTSSGFALIENSLGQRVYVDTQPKTVPVDDRKLRLNEAYMVGCEI